MDTKQYLRIKCDH